MKKRKLLLTSIVCLALSVFLASFLFAGDSDITKAEVREDVVKYQLDTVKLLAVTETAEITYRRVDATGAVAGRDVKIIFMNVDDSPDTPEDETSTEFTDLIQYIQNRIGAGDSLKLSITKAVKIKLGL